MEVSKLREDFLNKLQKEEYISNYLFENIKNTIPDIIPVNFNLDNYNNKVLDKEYIKYKEYFDTMYNDIDPEIHLDEEQIKAILSDEEYSLILAGAGTGKTTTMASKVKFLVDIKKVNPSKILVMSYTKKATQELEKRIVIDFGIPARVTTFHSLGFMYIREIFKEHKCYVVDSNLKNQIFLNSVVNRSGYMLLTLQAEAEYETRCARCLEKLHRKITLDLEKNAALKNDIREDDDDTVPVADSAIELDGPAGELLFLGLPTRDLCREDCRGLCPKCGKNLNEGDCGCDRKEIDPRLAVLKKFLDTDQ